MNSDREILPNLLNLISGDEIALSEFGGFLRTERLLAGRLKRNTTFDFQYLLKIHKLSLEHLYSFAGEIRTVNLFNKTFPSTDLHSLSGAILNFENLLSGLKNTYECKKDLIKEVAIVHGELLLIHPFRQGNVRTAMVLASLMLKKQGYASFKFDELTEDQYQAYISAIRSFSVKNDQPMIGFMASIFPD